MADATATKKRGQPKTENARTSSAAPAWVPGTKEGWAGQDKKRNALC